MQRAERRGSSLGGARPKALVIDQHGHLSIAKLPKETDDYSVETWEEIALRLAERAGISTPHHALLEISGRGRFAVASLRSCWRNSDPFSLGHVDDGISGQPTR